MAVWSSPFRSSEGVIGNRSARMMTAVFGRLKPGVSLQQSQMDLSIIAGRMQSDDREFYPENRGYAIAAAPLQEALTQKARPTLLILLGAAGLVLLIACA